MYTALKPSRKASKKSRVVHCDVECRASWINQGTCLGLYMSNFETAAHHVRVCEVSRA
jgi:hypothetical protein